LTAGEGTADGHGRDRHRRAALTSATNIAGRAITLVATLATIPMTMRHLGPEEFGLWMVISSLTVLLGFADLGIGNGVLNAVATAFGRDDVPRIRAVVGAAGVMLAGVAAVVLLLGWVVVPWVDWSSVFSLTTSRAALDMTAALLVFAACFALSIPLGIVARVQMGLQLGYVAGFWQAAGSLAGLVGIYGAVSLGLSLPWLVAALLGGPLLASLVNTAWFFGRSRPDLRPAAWRPEPGLMPELLRLGALFLVLQIAVALAFASDNVIAAKLLGAEAITDFAVAARLFAVVSAVMAILLQPLWPAYAEAIARRDLAWVRQTLRRASWGAAALAALGSGVLVVAFDWITQLWLGRTLQISFLLMAGLALWPVLDAVGNSLASFLNGARVVGPQVVLASIFAASCVAAKIFMVRRFGIDALPWATILTYVALTLTPLLFLLKRLVARL
jgi:O-antigen/teichoic acid export membrane protein